jgi:hypothetical protein
VSAENQPEYEHPDQMMLRYSTGNFLMDRSNATLYTFWGDLATRDHVFLVTDPGAETDSTVTGTYIFNWSSAYEHLVEFMIENQYPCRLNQLSVPECDENAFNTALDQLSGKLDQDELDRWLDGEDGK